MTSNQAPAVKWFSTNFGRTVRQRLYVSGSETPYFIDTALVAAHRQARGATNTLYGSGMSATGSAGVLAQGKVQVLKHKAEQMAMEAA